MQALWGVILTIASTGFRELSTVIGKIEVEKHHETIHSMGFINLAIGFLIFLGIVIFGDQSFVLESSSLGILGIRFIFELASFELTVRAIIKADRSTFSFLRILTLPGVLIIDLILGYQIGILQWVGVLAIFGSIVWLLMHHGIRKKGIMLTVASALTAIVAIELFKYSIDTYHALAAEQMYIFGGMVIYFYCMARWREGQNPLRMIFKRPFSVQAITRGINHGLGSFAYLFAPATIIIAAKRGSNVLAGIISGNQVFHEGKLGIKLTAFVGITIGLILLVV
jgi:hypothetical protein